ncbi:3444_t:CDS:2 [Cetraspora pellucida]|uniref:3444_t:CDS:1 n=1 Tax=Cetraspora pellucida TaxID=1433469 RepID=A0A9N9I1D8_9GLOM|nr:3444_t:CDS:2 [Cetraspora pellucida]
MSSVVVPTTFQIIESTEQTFLLGMDWFRQTGEILPAPLAIKVEPKKLQKTDNENPFDNFKFDDEDLDKAEGFLTNQCSDLKLYNNLWLDHESPAVYLSGIESISVEETEEEKKTQ